MFGAFPMLCYQRASCARINALDMLMGYHTSEHTIAGKTGRARRCPSAEVSNLQCSCSAQWRATLVYLAVPWPPWLLQQLPALLLLCASMVWMALQGPQAKTPCSKGSSWSMGFRGDLPSGTNRAAYIDRCLHAGPSRSGKPEGWALQAPQTASAALTAAWPQKSPA